MERDDTRVLTAEYALGLLAEDERRAMARRLGDDAALQAELAFWQERFAGLMPGEEVTPPAHVLTGIRAELFGEERRSLLQDILHPTNRGAVIAIGAAKVALIAAVLWLLAGR